MATVTGKKFLPIVHESKVLKIFEKWSLVHLPDKVRLFDISWPPISLLDLHLLRILFCTFLFYIDLSLMTRYFHDIVHLPSWHPIPLFETIGMNRMELQYFEPIYYLYLLVLCLCILGWKTRAWLFLALILFFVLHGQLLSLTKSPDSPYVYHSKNIIPFVLLILAMDSRISKSSNILSLLTQTRRLARTMISSHSAHLIMLSYACVYFGASYLRILNSGFHWMDGFTLQSYLFQSYFAEGSQEALWIAQHHYLSQLLSILTIVFELTFLWLLIFFRPYHLLFLAGLIFHFSIYWIMKINFFKYFSFGYLAFLLFPPLSLSHLFLTIVNKISRLGGLREKL